MTPPRTPELPPRRARLLFGGALALLLLALAITGLSQPPWLAGTDPQEIEAVGP